VTDAPIREKPEVLIEYQGRLPLTSQNTEALTAISGAPRKSVRDSTARRNGNAVGDKNDRSRIGLRWFGRVGGNFVGVDVRSRDYPPISTSFSIYLVESTTLTVGELRVVIEAQVVQNTRPLPIGRVMARSFASSQWALWDSTVVNCLR
jgi:hypothetical protein